MVGAVLGLMLCAAPAWADEPAAVLLHLDGHVTLTHVGHTAASHPDTRFGNDDRITTSERTSATFVLCNHAELRMQADTAVVVYSVGPYLARLEHGAVHLSHAPAGSQMQLGDSFAVVTTEPDTELDASLLHGSLAFHCKSGAFSLRSTPDAAHNIRQARAGQDFRVDASATNDANPGSPSRPASPYGSAATTSEAASGHLPPLDPAAGPNGVFSPTGPDTGIVPIIIKGFHK